MNSIIEKDLNRIHEGLSPAEKAKFKDSVILITGGAGFLGFYFVHYFARYKNTLGIKEIIVLDNFLIGYPLWLKELASKESISLCRFNVITDDISSINGAAQATHIYHMASVASPTFYRTYPIETLDANIWGLRSLLEFYKDKEIKGLAFFSSSEIYGDPSPENIPTSENYNGNVSCVGPRACYDEAKRFGETMCYLFNQKYGIPISIIRPFNNFGPGMRLNDKRLPADFAKAVYENRDITIFSDGTPTRTFCYISDAVTGYMKASLHESFQTFNIGMDIPEISVADVAALYQKIGKEIFGYTGTVKLEISKDAEYLAHNPNRRCPDISKARTLLDYNPKVLVEEGIRDFLQFIKESPKEFLEW